MISRILLAFLILTAVTACAGQHVRPAVNYAIADARTVRVAFDQQGDTYPRDTTAVDWSTFKPRLKEANFGGAFTLQKHYEHGGGKGENWLDVRKRARQDAAAALNKALKDGDTLVVLIHGFNNSYSEAGKVYSLMRSRVEVDPQKIVFLEVFWDGLQLRNEKAVSGYVTFWPDALTYSNISGQYGLRDLLNSIERNIDLRFVTHSRGVGVALSSLIDPAYDKNIECPGKVRCTDPSSRPLPFRNSRIRSIKIAAFAPAIGSGHLLDDLDEQLENRSIVLLAGVNPKDRATSKPIAPSKFWGDTSLGSNLGYILGEQLRFRKSLDLRVGLFSHGKDHGLAAYFSNASLTDCFFATIDLRPEQKNDCALIGLRKISE